MPKIAPFENYSDAYDDWFCKNADTYAAELDLIRQLLPPSVACGMEVGVGSGKFAGPLGIRIGVDPSAQMAEKAKRQGIQVVRGVAENLPFADAVFDFVLMVTTICFVDDIEKSFAEARRILKTGGHLILGFVDKDSKLGRQYEAKREQSRFYKDAVFFSAPEVFEHLKKTGLVVKEIRQTLLSGNRQTAIIKGFGQGAFVGVSAEK